MFERILLLIGATPGDKWALEYGIALARSTGGEVHVAGVVEIPTVAASIDEVKDVEDERRYALDAALRSARDYAESAGQPVTTELIYGSTVDAVCRLIESRHIQLLVLGEPNGRLERDHRTLAQRAPCPVFVARERVVQEFVGERDHRAEHWELRREKRERLEGSGLMVQIFVGEHDRHEGRPLYELIVERLRALDIAGATVFAGELGFGASGHVHALSHLPWSHDRPMVITVVDTDDAARRAVDAASPLVTNGMIVTSPVHIVKYAYRSAPATAGFAV